MTTYSFRQDKDVTLQLEGLCAGNGRGRWGRNTDGARLGSGREKGSWTTRLQGFRGEVLGALFSTTSSSPPPPPPQGGDTGDVDGIESNGAMAQATERKGLSEAADIESAAASSASDSGVSGDRAVNAAEDEEGVVCNTGIGWTTLSAVVASQLAVFGFFGWISSKAIREQVISSFSASPAAAALGLAGMLPLLAYGLALDTRKDWKWVKKIDDATSEVALQLLGSDRQVAKVISVVIPLSMLVGFCEECAFRGFIPLVLATKTGLPPAAVVVISGIVFGALHAATFAYFLTATLSGIFFHGLFLSTGNIFVPIAAHAFYDAIALVRYHFKVTAPKPD